MPVVFLITIVAVLVGIFFAATGRGGEMAYEQADQAPLELGPVSAADVALLRPPTALWGYNMQVTDAALDQVARAMRERDVTIAYLQEQVASFERNGAYAEPQSAHARQAAGLAPVPGIFGLPDAPAGAEMFGTPETAGTFGAPGAADTLDDLPRLETPEAREPGPLDEFLYHETPEAFEPAEAPESFEPAEAPESFEPAEAPESFQPAEAPESFEAAETPEDSQAAEFAPDAEAAQAPPPAEAPPAETPGPPQTPLILKASPAKPPPAPESHEATQPSEVLQEPGSDETTGPQGDFNAHDWWAEQREAEQKEAAGQEDSGPPAGTAGGQAGDPLTTAEEQRW